MALRFNPGSVSLEFAHLREYTLFEEEEEPDEFENRLDENFLEAAGAAAPESAGAIVAEMSARELVVLWDNAYLTDQQEDAVLAASRNVLNMVARDPSTPQEALFKLAYHTNIDVASNAVRNLREPSALLDVLYDIPRLEGCILPPDIEMAVDNMEFHDGGQKSRHRFLKMLAGLSVNLDADDQIRNHLSREEFHTWAGRWGKNPVEMDGLVSLFEHVSGENSTFSDLFRIAEWYGNATEIEQLLVRAILRIGGVETFEAVKEHVQAIAPT